MAIVYLGIGSNLGDRRANCLTAVGLLRENGIIVSKESAQFETEPWGMADQPLFINMAVKAETTLNPLELLKILKNIERSMGRTNGSRWGPRLIDIDILLYDDLIFSEENLIIPHPHLHKRRFVLEPLNSIEPEVVHPVLLKTIASLFREVCLAQDNIR